MLAQDVVSMENFDEEQFNKYVLEEVNKLRKRNRVDSLIHDPSLDEAANDHAEYMAKNNVLSHQQKNRLKQTPMDRVRFYKGSHEKVAENIQLFQLEREIEKSRGRLTYQKLAREIVDNWKGSSGHFKNMVNEDYTGVSHQYVLKDGKLYICQVLASAPFEPKYDYAKGETMYVKNKRECWNCRRFKKKSDRNQTHLGWYEVSNDSIYYLNTDVVEDDKGKLRKGNLRKLFSARGAVAIDVVHQEQFSCSGNTSYHGALHYDGYYLGYVSKASLKNDLSPHPALIKVYVGMKPAFVDTFFQVDFNLVKRWRPCMHGMTIYVNPDFLRPEEYFRIPEPIIRQQNIVISDSVEVRIPFEVGQTDEDTTIFQPLQVTLDSLQNKNYDITSIYFTGVASIEGTEEGNELLFERRGKLIRDYLKRYFPDFELQSNFYENFDDFRAGLLSLGVPNAMNMSEDSLRLYANLNKSKPQIKSLLDETRYAFVQIVYEDVVPLENSGYGLSVYRLSNLIENDKVRDALPLYEYLSTQIFKGNLIEKKDSLLDLDIPETETFAKLHWYDFILRLNVIEEYEATAETLNKLKGLGAIPTDADYLEYRLLFNIFNRNEAIDVSDFGDIFPEVRRKRQKAWIECLELISGVENFRYDPSMAVPILVEKTLKKKFDVHKTYFICQYLIMWGHTVEPYILLSKYARRPGQFAKLYKQYLKLGYFLGQYDDEKEWKRLRIIMKQFAQAYPGAFCELFKWDEMGVRSLSKAEIAELFCEFCRKDSQ